MAKTPTPRAAPRGALVNAAAKALHEEHMGRIAQGFELPPYGHWRSCSSCQNTALIAVTAAMERHEKDGGCQ